MESTKSGDDTPNSTLSEEEFSEEELKKAEDFKTKGN
jgi:hypothetical protein